MHRLLRVISDEGTLLFLSCQLKFKYKRMRRGSPSWTSAFWSKRSLHVRRHENNYRTRIHRMKRGVYRIRDGQRSFFWEVGCSLCIMNRPRAASAGFLLYLHVWTGSTNADGMAGSQPSSKIQCSFFFSSNESIDHEQCSPPV